MFCVVYLVHKLQSGDFFFDATDYFVGVFVHYVCISVGSWIIEILLLVRIGVYHRNQMLPVPGYFFGDMTVWKVQNKASFWQTKSDNSLSVLKIVLTLAIASEERWVLLLSYSARRYSMDYSSCCKLEYPINSGHSPRFKTKLLKRI